MNVLGKVVAFVAEVLKKIAGILVDAIDGLLSSAGFGKFLLYAALGVGLYMVLSKDSDKSQLDVTMNTPASRVMASTYQRLA